MLLAITAFWWNDVHVNRARTPHTSQSGSRNDAYKNSSMLAVRSAGRCTRG